MERWVKDFLAVLFFRGDEPMNRWAKYLIIVIVAVVVVGITTHPYLRQKFVQSLRDEVNRAEKEWPVRLN
jgi:hypothetical protein